MNGVDGQSAGKKNTGCRNMHARCSNCFCICCFRQLSRCKKLRQLLLRKNQVICRSASVLVHHQPRVHHMSLCCGAFGASTAVSPMRAGVGYCRGLSPVKAAGAAGAQPDGEPCRCGTRLSVEGAHNRHAGSTFQHALVRVVTLQQASRKLCNDAHRIQTRHV